MRPLTLVPLFAAVVLAAPLSAQDTASVGPLRSAVSATKPMTRVRVELRGGQRLTGTLVAAEPATLAIEDESGARRAVPYADVTRYWEWRRAVTAGAVTGGIIGAGTGAFLGLVAVAVCEYDCPSSVTGSIIVGGLIVGAAGALAGGVVGAAIPRWSQRWRSAQPPAPGQAAPLPAATDSAPRASPRTREVGEVTFIAHGGYGGYPSSSGIGEPGAMGGASAGLAFRIHRLTFGPDLGLFAGAETMVAAQWLFRLDLADRHKPGMVPYAVAGAGGNTWDSALDEVGYFTGTFGAGVTFGDRHQWRAEARWSPVLQYSTSGPHPTLFTAGIGKRFSW